MVNDVYLSFDHHFRALSCLFGGIGMECSLPALVGVWCCKDGKCSGTEVTCCHVCDALSDFPTSMEQSILFYQGQLH